MPAIPSLNICGDTPCACANICNFKVLTAVIAPNASPDESGNYCPGCYTMIDGEPSTNCASITHMLAWIASLWTDFQNDTDYPWNTFTTGLFANTSATSPASVTGPGGFAGYGNYKDGSGYTIDYGLTALNGAAAGNACAACQVIGLQVSGNLFLEPLNVPEGVGSGTDFTEACLEPPPLISSPFFPNTYYVPMPLSDLCASGPGVQIEYVPYQTGNIETCLPPFLGGDSYTACGTPDPFFGSDPP